MFDVLRSYLKRLTNLTGNNKSILHLRLSGAQDIDLHDFDFLLNKPSFSIIEELLSRKSQITLCDELDSRDSNTNLTSKRLKAIKRKSDFILHERGAKDLYVGYPFVEGQFSDGTNVRCPLLFFPVEIEVLKGKWKLQLRKDVNVTFNQSFLLAYSHFNEVSLNEELLERTFNEVEKDSRTFRNNLYQILKESDLEVNFNQDLFGDNLRSFVDFKKADYKHQYQQGQLKLSPTAILGIYPQAGSYLVPDYKRLLESQAAGSLEEFFVHKSKGSFKKDDLKNPHRFIKEVREDQTFTPYHIDASQENAIKAVKQGNSLVVQGPPGSGKSQLICNLVADFIARGKKVLVVCQKRAALDVVHARLKEKNVADFTALVHDFKNDRKAIYDQINDQIERIDDYKTKNNSLDAIFLERNFLQTSRRIDQIVEELEEFKTALFDLSECGLSIKELYLTSSKDDPTIDLRQEYKHLKFDEANAFVQVLKNYIPYYLRFENQDYPWKERVSFKDFDIHDLQQLEGLLEEIPSYESYFRSTMKSIIGEEISVQESSWVLDRKESMENMITVIKPKKIFKFFKHLLLFTSPNINDEWLLQKEKQLTDVFREGIEMSLEHEELVPFQDILHRRIGSNRNIIKLIRWRLSGDKAKLKETLFHNNLEYSRKGFKRLRQLIDNRLNFEHYRTRLWETEWLIDIPTSLHLKDYQNYFHNVSVAIGALNFARELRSFSEHYLKIDLLDYNTLEKEFKEVIKLCNEADQNKKIWLRHLTNRQVSHILEDKKHVSKLKMWLDQDFDALCDYDRIDSTLKGYHRDIITRLFDNAERKTVDNMIALFDNSIRISWINHIETKYPVLRTVSSNYLNSLEQELQTGIKEKTRLSKDILLLKVREETYRDVEYNRLNNRVTYRELQHQVTKKKKIWPLRKTIENFHSEIFSLVPCWMASPESVSAMFPLQEMFDLVIFDEASQCFAEKGLPAAFRGKQIVIAGDSKQLSPNDLYQVRYEDESDENPDLEIDSLLDLASMYLMQVGLTGHYRSQSLDLIDFSNKHFYKGKLQLLPSYEHINQSESGINYVKVAGIWEKNSNDIEANKVVETLFDLLKSEEKSVGIVTFNAKQQELILDKIEEKSLAENCLIPESVFVKNIENVQGDERDIIIFSLGYAPSPSGKFTMNFGSLNMENGENRLNVAITRACKKIIIVSSILPQQLQVEDTKHPGPKLLKQYLEYAFEVSSGGYTPSMPVSDSFSNDWFLKSKLPKIFDDLDNLPGQLVQELPFSDLVAKRRDEYREIILTDDDLYHDALSVKASHAFVPLSLKQKKWKYKKIYSREFWRSKTQLKGELIKLIG